MGNKPGPTWGIKLALDIGYKIQDSTGEFVMNELLDDYSSGDPISSPVGFIQSIDYNNTTKEVILIGWAIDKKTPPTKIKKIVWLDDIYINENKSANFRYEFTPLDRTDIKEKFPKYHLLVNSGFILKFKIPDYKLHKKPRLRITLQNDAFRWVNILNRSFDLQKSFSRLLF